MLRYEVSELHVKPKVVSQNVSESEVVFDVGVYFFVEFEDGRRTPVQQWRTLEIKASEIELIRQKIVHPLVDSQVEKFIQLLENNKINLADLVSMNKTLILRSNSLKRNEVEYFIV